MANLLYGTMTIQLLALVAAPLLYGPAMLRKLSRFRRRWPPRLAASLCAPRVKCRPHRRHKVTTAYDLKERRRAVANAVASQRLEGLEPDSRTIRELERVAEGTSSVSDLINTLRSRVAAGEFRTPSSAQR